ncbi:hypothetical protein [Geotalea uraniireducens]|uniref:Uncharacterized protein n=1 Tax=Geotalea uraniireducens (strain Rf4) TaxID=351605 RepID=A5GD71_GEOUR|nr:hypothetical protein [Geotalea uraniireducens]ABQ24474.1 hypothetical protein Gura_0258 [Geotalea uraniireducens Rf4]
MQATIQIFHHGRWRTAGMFTPDRSSLDLGIVGGGLPYDIDYVLDHATGETAPGVALRYPVTFELHRSDRWPAFLLDIMPTGAGRRVWLRRLDLRDGAEADWELLVKGGRKSSRQHPCCRGCNPPCWPASGVHPGGDRREES